MERFDSERFISGIRSLKRELGEGIFDKKELYYSQTHAEQENAAIRAIMRERNLRYVQQRRQKEKQSLQIDVSSTYQVTKGSDTGTPSEHSYAVGSITSRAHLSPERLGALSPTFGPNFKKSKYYEANNNTSLETNDRTATTNQTKEISQLPVTKKSTKKLDQANRFSSHRFRQATEFSLLSQSIANSGRSPLPQLSELQSPRSNHGGFLSPFERSKSQRELSLNAKSLKKFAAAKRVISVVNEGSRDLALSTQRGDFTSAEKRRKTKLLIEEYYRNIIDMLGSAYDILALAVLARKDKLQIDKYLNDVLTCAQKSHNIEFYITALKTQAKIFVKFKDLYRAIGSFKGIKRIADDNLDLKFLDSSINKNYLRHRLSSYKSLGKCFQMVQNYKRAIFYYVKMLQTAWALGDQMKELLAYDMIGIQYYYQGEIDNANYYHQKLMNGATEKAGSELRELGIQKLITHIQDKNHNKVKHEYIKSVEEELTAVSNPSSDDEFTLPEPFLLGNGKDGRKKETSLFGSDKRAKLIPLLMEQKKSLKPKKAQHTGPSTVAISNSKVEKFVFESIAHPPKPAIYLSHLSPNRFLKNFHGTDTKDIINAYVNTENLYGDRVRSITLDRQSLEDVKRILEQFRNNIGVIKIEVERMLASNSVFEFLPQVLASDSKTS